MTELHVTLYGDDAEWFREIKKELKDRRNGAEPSNAEVLRRLMEKQSHEVNPSRAWLNE
jgi:hypothetical protein